MSLLKINNLNYSVKENLLFVKEEKHILKNISFSISGGEIFGIAGESGSGKTTLLKILAGILPFSSGEILWDHNLIPGQHKIQILFQNSRELLNPVRKVYKILDDPFDKSIDRDTKKMMLNKVELQPEILERYVFQLSGGELQRTALARLLASEPQVLLLDEPFSAQDVESQLNLINLLKKLNEKFGITMICVSHNMNLLRRLTDSTLVMRGGEMAEMDKTEIIFNSPKNIYTKFLLKAEQFDLDNSDFKLINKSD